MIWSLLKILLFVAAVIALTVGAGMLMEADGGLRIAFADTEIVLQPLQLVIVALVALAALWLLFKLVGLLLAVLRFLNGDETALSRFFSRNRERRGFQALTDGLLALASGEGALARKKAAKADKLLRKPELTNLIAAQAAAMEGDRALATDYYKRLLADERTRFVGLRGVMRQKLDAGDTEAALKLARKAFTLKPGHTETQDVLLRLQAEQDDWAGARQTLLEKKRHGALPRDVFRRRDGVLALQQALQMRAEGDAAGAHTAAIEAHRLAPDHIPAAVMAARAHIADANARKAASVIKKAWTKQPHPELAAAFAEIAPRESHAARLKRFGALTRQAPDHPETKMLLAELHIAAEDFPAARRALGDLVTTHPNQRVLTIMAAIERGEGSDDAVVRGWLTRALSAPRGPQWVCEACHHIHPRWVAVCENCAGFDTLSWREPPQESAPSPTQTEMLPLIAGTPDKPAGATPARAAPAGDPPPPQSPRPDRGDTGPGAGAAAAGGDAEPAKRPDGAATDAGKTRASGEAADPAGSGPDTAAGDADTQENGAEATDKATKGTGAGDAARGEAAPPSRS